MGDILVDGYNVIKNNAMFQAMEIKNFSHARALLIKQLHNKFRFTSHQVIVVFDGDGNYEDISHQDHIRVIYSRYDQIADDVIKRLAAEAKVAGRAVLMYSDDMDVREGVSKHGGTPLSTRDLTQKLNEAPSDVAIRSAHRQHARRIYGIDPSKKDEHQYDQQHKHEKAKKKKRGRYK